MGVGWGEREGRPSVRLAADHAGLARLRTVPEEDLARRVRVVASDILDSWRGPLVTLPALPGRFGVDDDGAWFIPRFPPMAGTAYTVLVHRSLTGTEAGGGFELDDFEAFTLVVDRPLGEGTTSVVEIHPTVAEIPFNQLRLYVRFSAPMSEGFATDHLHVVDAATRQPLDDALLPMEPELWDPARCRLTVLFDPARIKRGLAPHREVGYPLRPGTAVVVIVDGAWPDATGRPLAAPVERRYAVGADVRTHVDPAKWTLAPPRRGTRNPLVVDLDRPLDHGLLQRCLRVGVPGGAPLTGGVAVAQGERSWAFVPDRPWSDGDLELRVDPILEDLAGNSVARVFDRDLSAAADAPRPAEVVCLPFRPR